MSDGLKYTGYPTGGNLWIVGVNSTAPVTPAPTTGLTDWFTPAFTMTNGWEGHASYSRGGTDWGMPVGTEIKAVADGTIRNYPNIDGAGLKTMLVFDASFTRKIAASPTVMNGVYTENPTAPAVAFMMQHLSAQVTERHVVSGEVVAISGNTGQTTGPHLHAQLLATADVGADRLDFLKFV
jgi:murein DD-endopeptidase MepM/ murein hydrolase activator NlpD